MKYFGKMVWSGYLIKLGIRKNYIKIDKHMKEEKFYSDWFFAKLRLCNL